MPEVVDLQATLEKQCQGTGVAGFHGGSGQEMIKRPVRESEGSEGV
jgi:hypothetical protein